MDDHEENGRRLSVYRQEIHFESQMLSSRLGEYLSAQSFLIIAYASSMSAGWSKPGIFLLLVPLPMTLLGLVLSIDAQRSIKSSYQVIDRWHDRQNALMAQKRDLASYWPTQNDDEDAPSDPTLKSNFYRGSRFATRSPWIFIVTWIYLATVSIGLFVGGE
ncbi:RipA family octameric membrane protein [Falsirhodobacter sp. 1013]|uniref:RipA family octameric membrane protein n=1 Tax=Falsirhodobacter sp. 1013 TaxID=3417566 RepID=UPI003EB9102A